jgi:perosamine synthetase
VPTFTFYATATPLLLLRAEPVLCDAGDRYGNVTADSIAAVLTERTRAVVVTHLFGWPCDLDPIVELCRRHGLALIEDCSHAHGSTYRGRRVGTFGDLAAFSIGGQKMVSGGLGGMLLSRRREHHEIACLLANFRPRTRHTVHDPHLRNLVETGLGGNFRISPVAAVLALSHLAELDRMAEVRDRNARRLLAGLTGLPGIRGDATPAPTDRRNGGWYGVNAAVDPEVDLDAVIARMQRCDLRVRRPATIPLHRSALFRSAAPPTWSTGDRGRWLDRFRDATHPVADDLYQRWLAYPATFLHDEMGLIVDAYVERSGDVLRTAVAA